MDKHRFGFNIRPWLLVSIAWVVPALFGVLDAYAQNGFWTGAPNWRAMLFTGLDWLVYGFLTPFVFILARRFPLSRDRLRRNVILHIIFAILFCFIWAGIGTGLKVALQGGGLKRDALQFYVGWVFTTFPFGVAVYFAMVGVEHAIRYFVEARERERQVELLSGQLSTARLAALQSQLNPHFLFNSLNTISVLVRDGDPGTAIHVIEELSDVLRTTLSRSRAAEVSLDDEIALVRQYLGVERARFSDRLRPVYDVPAALRSAAVPGFSLQHLVENAIRHGIAQRSDAGRIAIAARRDGALLELSVRDDGPGVAADAVSRPAHGIENTRERLTTLYGAEASLSVTSAAEGGTIAVIRIPYRELMLDTNDAIQ